MDAGNVGCDLVGGCNGICNGGRARRQDDEVVDGGRGLLAVGGKALEQAEAVVGAEGEDGDLGPGGHGSQVVRDVLFGAHEGIPLEPVGNGVSTLRITGSVWEVEIRDLCGAA